MLGILFEKQNVAFLVGLTFGIAASANFPVLILSMYWKGLTTRGALLGGLTGLVSAVVLVILSQAVWVVVLGNPAPIFPYDQPALFSMPLAFLVTYGSPSLTAAHAPSERAAFDDSSSAHRPALALGCPARDDRECHNGTGVWPRLPRSN